MPIPSILFFRVVREASAPNPVRTMSRKSSLSPTPHSERGHSPTMGSSMPRGEFALHFPRFPGEKKMSESEICLRCHGCCMYVTAPLQPPRAKHQKDMFRWYLLHQNVEIYIDLDRHWQILFKTPCNHLLTDGVCSTYETRPDICREYQADACSRTGKDHLEIFRSPAELDAYFKRKAGSRGKTQTKRSS